MQLDWGLGEYEVIARQLLPASRVVVDRAAIQPAEQVVDVGCGTGNAALLAAERGAGVTGVDPAQRLLEVARREAAGRGLDNVTFVSGTAAALPLADDSADVVLSVFAVIFAPDPAAAVAEMARVCTRVGRIVVSAWIPRGGIFEFTSGFQKAVLEASGAPPGPPRPPWHEREFLSELFAPHGFAVEVEEHGLPFTAPSVSDYLEVQSRSHPLSIAGRRVLESSGASPSAAERARAILEAANEDPSGFRVTSPYVVATARRG